MKDTFNFMHISKRTYIRLQKNGINHLYIVYSERHFKIYIYYSLIYHEVNLEAVKGKPTLAQHSSCKNLILQFWRKDKRLIDWFNIFSLSHFLCLKSKAKVNLSLIHHKKDSVNAIFRLFQASHWPSVVWSMMLYKSHKCLLHSYLNVKHTNCWKWDILQFYKKY